MRRLASSALAATTSAFVAIATLVVVLPSADSALAQTIDLSWHGCSPIVYDVVPVPGSTLTAYASVTGQSQAHRAYQVWWVVGDIEDRLPDAWRFDGDGCNAGRYTFTAQPAAALAKSCPPLVPAATQQFTIPVYQLAPAGLGVPTTMGNGFLAVSYPTGSTAASAAQRYHAARFVLDFTYAVTGSGDAGFSCGGLERPLTLRLVPDRSTWLDVNLQEFVWEYGNATLHVNGGASENHARTWGQVKGQYRR
jgi:hypothetical protein